MRLPPAALAAPLLALAALAALPGAVAAHSELVSSTPADGAVAAGGPAEIVGEFSAPVDPGRSSMALRGPDGAQLARGGVPEDGPATRMVIADLPALAPGTYTVRWTTVTPDDDGVERGTFRFTVEAATPGPTTTPAPTASPAPMPAATPTPGATPAASPTAGATAAPSPSATPDPVPAAGAGDLLVPLVALVAVLAAGAAWLRRRR